MAEEIFTNDISFDDPVDITINQAKNIELKDKYDVPPEDVYERSAEYIDNFDEVCQTEGIGYEAPGYPIWSEKMEGLMNGFYIFAGFSNSGKTAFASNLAFDYALNPDNHLFMIYYSLDDTKEDVLARLISMKSRIPISIIRKPKRFEQFIHEGKSGSGEYIEALKKRKEALEVFKKYSKHFMVRDGDDIDCIERMLNHAKMVKQYLRARDEKANLIIVIDSLMDINIDSKNFREERDRNTEISKLVKRYATTEIKCPIFGTAHVKKNTSRRISVSDLKESGRYEYDARAVFLITNDVSRNGQNADIFYTMQNDTMKHPVLEIYWAKNKASSFKERTYCYFCPELSLAKECSKEQAEAFDAIIYGD